MPRVTLGRIAGVFGVRGWVRLQSFTRPVENLLDYTRWIVVHQGREIEMGLLEGQIHRGGLVAQIGDANGVAISDRDVAAALIGAEIQVAREELPELDEGEYYWADLIGLQVRNEAGEALGTVDHMTSNGAQDVMVLKDGEVERLIPFVQGPIVKSVDLQQKSIVADWQRDY